MSNDYTYLCSNDKKAEIFYYRGIPAAKSSKAIPLPKQGTKPDGTGKYEEAWRDKRQAAQEDVLEGGLYRMVSSISPSYAAS
jgi:hypothetical protein